MQFQSVRAADSSAEHFRLRHPWGGDVATSHQDQCSGSAEAFLQNSSREGEGGKTASHRSSLLAPTPQFPVFH